jgi:glycosyltransferase involved in cell wall biosynthesis
MKTILLITPYLPYRDVGHAGGKAIYDFIVELKRRGFKVCLASLAWPEESRHFESLRQLCDDTYLFASVPVFTDTLFNTLLGHPVRFFPKVIQGVVKHIRVRRLLNSGIREIIQDHDPDIVQVEYTTMVLYLQKLKSTRLKVLHLHDLMVKPYTRLWMAEKNRVARLFRFLFFAAVKYVELTFCGAFDVVLVKSEYDKKVLGQHGSLDTAVFPLGIYPQTQIAPYTCREPGSILFVGAMFRKVNEDAALFFIEHVLARLEEKVQSVKLYIVGVSPSKSLRKKASNKIIVTGFVEDLSSFYRRCQVSVAPLFVGGGMIFKVLEAMNFGLPVVSSTIANEGIEARDGSEILLADDAEEFADRIAAVMTDPDLWQRISFAAHALVGRKYSWDVVIQNYLQKVNTAVK